MCQLAPLEKAGKAADEAAQSRQFDDCIKLVERAMLMSRSDGSELLPSGR